MVQASGKYLIVALGAVLSVACLVTGSSVDDQVVVPHARFSLNSLANFVGDGMRNQLLKGELTNARTGYDCTNKPDGNYPDPVDQCSGSFYMCTNGYDDFFDCALQGTVFDPTLDRCEYCQLVYPCNADPNNIRCPGGGSRPTCPPYDPSIYICVCGANSCQLQVITTIAPPRPTCPAYDPNVYICVCGATSCNLELIRPTCPPYDPNINICVCGATSCQLELITTTARPAPTCPPYDPSVYICVCGALSCNLEVITTTTTARPTCPPFDPSVYICVCGATSCNLQLITTTTTPRPTCPPYDPSVYICVCGVSSCSLQLITTTSAPRPTCPAYDPNVYVCVCGATSCALELLTTSTTRPAPTCPPYDPSVYICVCGITSCNLELISTTRAPTGGPTAPCPGRTIGTTPSNSQLSCAGKPDGNYVDPFDPCSGGFYMCTNGDPDYFICALQGTVFDPAQDRCDYCNVVAVCNTFGHLY